MADVTLKQVRSANGASPQQRDTLRSLKLGRIGKRSTMDDTPQLAGHARASSSTWSRRSRSELS